MRLFATELLMIPQRKKVHEISTISHRFLRFLIGISVSPPRWCKAHLYCEPRTNRNSSRSPSSSIWSPWPSRRGRRRSRPKTASKLASEPRSSSGLAGTSRIRRSLPRWRPGKRFEVIFGDFLGSKRSYFLRLAPGSGGASPGSTVLAVVLTALLQGRNALTHRPFRLHWGGRARGAFILLLDPGDLVVLADLPLRRLRGRGTPRVHDRGNFRWLMHRRRRRGFLLLNTLLKKHTMVSKNKSTTNGSRRKNTFPSLSGRTFRWVEPTHRQKLPQHQRRIARSVLGVEKRAFRTCGSSRPATNHLISLPNFFIDRKTIVTYHIF